MRLHDSLLSDESSDEKRREQKPMDSRFMDMIMNRRDEHISRNCLHMHDSMTNVWDIQRQKRPQIMNAPVSATGEPLSFDR